MNHRWNWPDLILSLAGGLRDAGGLAWALACDLAEDVPALWRRWR